MPTLSRIRELRGNPQDEFTGRKIGGNQENIGSDWQNRLAARRSVDIGDIVDPSGTYGALPPSAANTPGFKVGAEVDPRTWVIAGQSAKDQQASELIQAAANAGIKPHEMPDAWGNKAGSWYSDVAPILAQEQEIEPYGKNDWRLGKEVHGSLRTNQGDWVPMRPGSSSSAMKFIPHERPADDLRTNEEIERENQVLERRNQELVKDDVEEEAAEVVARLEEEVNENVRGRDSEFQIDKYEDEIEEGRNSDDPKERQRADLLKRLLETAKSKARETKTEPPNRWRED